MKCLNCHTLLYYAIGYLLLFTILSDYCIWWITIYDLMLFICSLKNVSLLFMLMIDIDEFFLYYWLIITCFHKGEIEDSTPLNDDNSKHILKLI